MTPAARQFHAWLDAANSDKLPGPGGPIKLAAFFKENCPWLPADHHLDLDLQYLRTGGIDLKHTGQDSETRYVGLIQDHAQGLFRRVIIEVEPQDPWHLTRFDVELADAPPELATPRLTEADAIAASKQYLAEAEGNGTFSGTALVARRGETVFTGAYGWQDRDGGIRNSVGTRFRIASMGKMFTAVAVLQLAQQGMLGLHDPISRYLPDYPDEEAAAKVTCHHLLSHSSGVCADVLRFWAGRRDQARPLRTLEDHMMALGVLGLEFEPGTQWAYTNFGYVLLGLIVQRVAGQDYYGYIRQHVFTVVEMASSGFEADAAGQRDSVGYMRQPDSGELVAGRDGIAVAQASPSGGAFSTVEDIKRFADALTQYRLLDAEHYRLLTEGKIRAGTLGSFEAYGCEEFRANGVRLSLIHI